MLRRRWFDVLIILLASWLVVSTFVLGLWIQSAVAAWINITGGVLAGGVAVLDLRQPTVWDEWALFFLGACLAFSPYYADYGTAHRAEIQAVAAGLLLIILATAAGNARHWREPLSHLNDPRH